MEMDMQSTQTGTKNDYTYNGKELNDDFDLNLSDYGARWYDASIGRWHSVDPLAEKFNNLTPYHYVTNNPMNVIDPDGRDTLVMNRSKLLDRSDENTHVWAITFSLISNGVETQLKDDDGKVISYYMIGNKDYENPKENNNLPGNHKTSSNWKLEFRMRGSFQEAIANGTLGEPEKWFENEIQIVGAGRVDNTQPKGGVFIHRGKHSGWYAGCKGVCPKSELSGTNSTTNEVTSNTQAEIRLLYNQHKENLTGKNNFIMKTNAFTEKKNKRKYIPNGRVGENFTK